MSEPEFVPWLGDVGERGLAGSDDWLSFVDGAEHSDEEAVPPHASSEGEDWDWDMS